MQVSAFDTGCAWTEAFPVPSKNAIMGARMAAMMALMISFQASMGGKGRGRLSLGRPAGSQTTKANIQAAKRKRQSV
jgi:hypothetical protein